jgi:acetyltransferase-like isoleucine patch superfamily enzyme
LLIGTSKGISKRLFSLEWPQTARAYAERQEGRIRPDMSAPLEIDASATIDPDARIYPSTRGSRIVIGAHTQVDAFAVIRAVGGRGDVVIGEYCRVNPHCVLYSGNGIRLGDHVLVAPHVSIVPTNHAFERRDIPIDQQRHQASRGGVVIEDDVWIGAQSVILDGAHLERGSIVAAGSIVLGRVPAYQVWGGSPATFLKERP